MSDVSVPALRRGVIEGLETITRLSLETLRRSPDLTEACHLLLDDTSWDSHSPSDDIGICLKNAEEAKAISAVLDPLLAILDELGPAEEDLAYLNHDRWVQVQTASADAIARLDR